MPRITDEQVAEINDRIAQAPTAKQAFDLIDGCTPTMINKLLDLNGIDVSLYLGGLAARRDEVAECHGWDWNDRDDDVPADGHGPCSLGRFEAHSRRPAQCRECRRRKIDHCEPVRVADPLAGIVAHPQIWPNYIDNPR
jgi:hypothetical protein